MYARTVDLIDGLEDVFDLQTLKALAEATPDEDFKRLALEYLPLKFSRRHGILHVLGTSSRSIHVMR